MAAIGRVRRAGAACARAARFAAPPHRWLLLLLALLVPPGTRGGTTVSVYNQTQLAAAVADVTVSTIVLQRSFALTAGMVLSGRALTVVGNTSGCFDASVSPPPPPPPAPPPPFPPPPSPPGAPPPSLVVAASVTLQGYTALTLDTAKFIAGVNATMPAGATVAITNVTTLSTRRRQLLTPSVAVNFTVTTTAASATTAALGAPTALLANLVSAGLSSATSLVVVAVAAPTPAPVGGGGGPPNNAPGAPGPGGPGPGPQNSTQNSTQPVVPPSPSPSPSPQVGRRRLLASATASNTGSAAASAPLDGRCTLVLSASTRARHFTLTGANLTLQSVSLTGGYFNDATSGQAPTQTYVLTVSSPSDPAQAGGGAIFADAHSWVVATNVSMSYNTGYPRGGALCSLNTASDAVTLTGCSVNGNALLPQAYNGIPTLSSYLYGGAIYSRGGVTLTNCELSSNYVPKAGGVVSNGGAILAPKVTMVGCTLQNNFVRGQGGAVALIGCSSYTNSECAATITASVLSYNSADMGGALSSDVMFGATYIYRVAIASSSFVGNTAGAAGGSTVYGGAIALASASVQIDGSTFSDNAVSNGDAGVGGAVYVGPLLVPIGGIIPLLNVTVTSSTFFGNNATGAGGALYLQTAYKYMQGQQPADWSLVSVVDTLLDSNYAGISGGALYLSCAAVSLTRVTCTNNVADADNGGCAAVSTARYATTNQPLDALGGFAVADSALSFNSAVSGGALALGCSRQTADSTLQSYYLNGGGACNLTLSVSNTSMVGNVASAQGGAVYNLAGGSLVLSAGTVLQNNTATGMSASGGAVFQADYINPFTAPALAIDAAELSGNSVSLVASSLLPGETATSTFGAGLGGAVNIAVTSTSGATMRISDGTTLWGNSAVSGGAVFAYGSLAISATSSALTNNVASDRGGAVLLQSSTSISSVVSASLVNVTMSGNNAYRGGAVALNAGSTLTASSSAFTANSASLGGGVFFMQTGTLTSPVVAMSGACNASGNLAYAGGLAFTDAVSSINPPSFDSSCYVSGNSVVSMAPLIASPPVRFEVDAPSVMRTGTSIGLAAKLYDAFNNTALVWPGVTATVAASDSSVLSGPTLTGYANGAAVFNSTTLRGPVGSTYQLSVLMTSSNLLDIVTSQVGNVNVTVAPCAANEEFQVTSSLCVCSAGYAPTISSGCIACAPGTYAPAAGSSRCSVCASGAVSGIAATSCTSCPANSVVAANQCACAVGYYDANFGASAVAPLCTECPLGATCTTGTLGAAEGFWREALNDTVFLACREGNCLEEEVTGPLSSQSSVTDNTTTNSRRRILTVNVNATDWPATNCVEGNTGPLCGLCIPGYTLQSGVCAPCSPSDAFDAWSTGSKAGLLVGCIIFAIIVLAVAVFQPIAPAVENSIAATVSAAQAAKSRLVSCITCACCRGDADAAKGKSKIPPSPCCSEDEPPVMVMAASDPAFAAVKEAHKPAPEPAFSVNGLHNTATEPAFSVNDVHEPTSMLTSEHAAEHAVLSDEAPHKAAHHKPTHHTAEAAHAAADAHAQAAHFAHGFGLMAMASAAAGGGGDDSDSGDSGSGSGSGEGVDGALDFMDELEELVEKLQRVSKILLKCASLSLAALLHLLTHRCSFSSQLLSGMARGVAAFHSVLRPPDSSPDICAQIVSTFLKSLDIPWPSIFGTIMARVSVVNLNLVQLPKTACLNPNPSFYSQFNGYTLGLVAAMLSAGVLHLFGTHVLARITLRNMPAAEREERLAKFHSTVLARALLVRALRPTPDRSAPDAALATRLCT